MIQLTRQATRHQSLAASEQAGVGGPRGLTTAHEPAGDPAPVAAGSVDEQAMPISERAASAEFGKSLEKMAPVHRMETPPDSLFFWNMATGEQRWFALVSEAAVEAWRRDDLRPLFESRGLLRPTDDYAIGWRYAVD